MELAEITAPTTVVDSVPESTILTVESPPDDAIHVDLPPPSDDDDRDGAEEDDKDHGSGGGDQIHESGVLTDDLKRKIIKQVEYYLSDENLPTDKYLLNLIKKNKEGYVSISTIATFRKMKKLTRDLPAIAAALKESSLLVVSSDGKKVKRLNPLPEVRDPKLFTVLVENLPNDHSVENLCTIFGEVGNVKNISIHDPHAIEGSEKSNKKETLISTKLHALVEYETMEAAEKAAATLNNEQDWRNGLRVKLLKQVGKYGQRRQAWREPDTEKNGGGRAHKQTGGEENRKACEHHQDTPEEEVNDGAHHHKDRNGLKGRNRGRSGRQNYHHHGNNGHGHGTTSSHPTEISKPPPGPRMPDGTRGFTMGRGRPTTSQT